MLHSQPVAVGSGTRTVLAARQGRQGMDATLDALTLVTPGTGVPLPDAITALLRREPATSAMVVLTGGLDAGELLPAVRAVRRSCKVVVTRVWPEGRQSAGALPGATLVDIDRLEAFAAAWTRLTR